MSAERHIYFAYGSNLDPEQMKERCPNSEPLGRAVLRGHRLDFTYRSRKRGCGVADVVSDPSSEVWGVLFSITDADRDRLDKSEGYSRETDSGAYLWRPKRVFPESNPEAEMDAFTYEVSTRLVPGPRPSREYLGQILKGAKHWKLPTTYLAFLSQTSTAA